MGKALLKLILGQIVFMFDEDVRKVYLIILYRALFLVMYYGLFRIGEVTLSDHVLKARDVHTGGNKKRILMLLYSSKTRNTGSRPQEIKIEANPIADWMEGSDDNVEYCPVAETRNYISVRPKYKHIDEPFFVYSNNTPVKADEVRQVLRTAIRQLELDPANYDTHSFRIGRATDQFREGISLDKIKKSGRWESNAVYKYLKHV